MIIAFSPRQNHGPAYPVVGQQQLLLLWLCYGNLIVFVDYSSFASTEPLMVALYRFWFVAEGRFTSTECLFYFKEFLESFLLRNTTRIWAQAHFWGFEIGESSSVLAFVMLCSKPCFSEARRLAGSSEPSWGLLGFQSKLQSDVVSPRLCISVPPLAS